jgi:hypothetical protein
MILFCWLNASSRVHSRAGVAVNKVQASCIGRYSPNRWVRKQPNAPGFRGLASKGLAPAGARAGVRPPPAFIASEQVGKKAGYRLVSRHFMPVKAKTQAPSSDDSLLLSASSRINSRASAIAHQVQASCIDRYNQADGYAIK